MCEYLLAGAVAPAAEHQHPWGASALTVTQTQIIISKWKDSHCSIGESSFSIEESSCLYEIDLQSVNVIETSRPPGHVSAAPPLRTHTFQLRPKVDAEVGQNRSTMRLKLITRQNAAG